MVESHNMELSLYTNIKRVYIIVFTVLVAIFHLEILSMIATASRGSTKNVFNAVKDLKIGIDIRRSDTRLFLESLRSFSNTKWWLLPIFLWKMLSEYSNSAKQRDKITKLLELHQHSEEDYSKFLLLAYRIIIDSDPTENMKIFELIKGDTNLFEFRCSSTLTIRLGEQALQHIRFVYYCYY